MKNSTLCLVLYLERMVSLVLLLSDRSVLSISKFFDFFSLVPFKFSRLLFVFGEVSYAMLLPILPVPFVGIPIRPEIVEISVKSTI